MGSFSSATVNYTPSGLLLSSGKIEDAFVIWLFKVLVYYIDTVSSVHFIAL